MKRQSDSQPRKRRTILLLASLPFLYVFSFFLAFPLTAYGVPVLGTVAANFSNAVHAPVMNALGQDCMYTSLLNSYARIVCEHSDRCRWNDTEASAT